MRVLAAYGLDDTLTLDRELTFVKSIFLLQIVHPDDLDVPENTIIHDLEITDVRHPHPTQPAPAPFTSSGSGQTLLLSPVLSVFLEVRFLWLPSVPGGQSSWPQKEHPSLARPFPRFCGSCPPTPAQPLRISLSSSSSRRMTPPMPAPSCLSPSSIRNTTSTGYGPA